ncbi:uracil-DNA glycosylase family protein [Desulfolutivibrio sulfoxidireducens]|uniref:uracil-DNA glycosylase family protein n=1 Tax=Desulfolutivibrio sulfoxidireducens TaxID=2773299 RepID=UPI00159D6531|nr:uracil-DNA glycosylase family protein [Desulfolutivibrio sulfoxidireducens]QLA15938.1 hypothetical protein GD605_07155 [Desulfolutivibrio sulfoxidireducens]
MVAARPARGGDALKLASVFRNDHTVFVCAMSATQRVSRILFLIFSVISCNMTPNYQIIFACASRCVTSSSPREGEMGDHPSVALFEKAAMVKPYPPSVLEVPHQLPSTAFFPGGYGLWLGNSLCGPTELPPFPFGGIMAVGQDFHSKKQYDQTRMHPGKNLTKGMWPCFKEVYEKAGADFNNTFFTNAYMGLRKEDKSTGAFSGATDKSFVKRCQSFFLEQVETQQPTLILALGKMVVPFMADLSYDLQCWNGKREIASIQNGKQIVEGARFGIKGHQCVVAFLLHPSMRNQNLRHRKYKELDSCPADIQVFKDALKAAGL